MALHLGIWYRRPAPVVLKVVLVLVLGESPAVPSGWFCSSYHIGKKRFQGSEQREQAGEGHARKTPWPHREGARLGEDP